MDGQFVVPEEYRNPKSVDYWNTIWKIRTLIIKELLLMESYVKSLALK